MSDKAAIAATFSDFKLIRGRKVAQIVLEIPIEKAQEALLALGMPIPGEELWCAVARLKSNPGFMGEGATGDGARSNAPQHSAAITSPAKPKRKFDELQPSQQAALRCQDKDFQAWVAELHGAGTDPVWLIRTVCKIDSRAELDANELALKAWRHIDKQYHDWLGQQRALAQHEAYAR